MIKKNCSGLDEDVNDLAYWRNDLFAGIIIYLLPLCLIALLPGLYWSFISGLYTVMTVDIMVVSGMIVIGFLPQLSIAVRKVIFLTCIYTLSYVLMYYLGLSGPGLLYLMAACIFSLLILPPAYAFWPAWLNTGICLYYAALIGLNLILWPHTYNHLMGEWIAVSSTVVFLSFLASALIPRIFKGLEATIIKEKQLKESLKEQQLSLQHAMNMLKQKNHELEQFAYVASHDLNEPLRMVTSFMASLKNKYGPQLDEKAHTYINFAMDGGKRMQRMISDLLDLSRTGRQDAGTEMISLEEILKAVKQNLFKLVEETRAEIRIETPLPTLFIIRDDLTRLFQNLIINAIKFRKKGTNPEIWISATETTGAWLIAVKDNGIGIAEEKLEKVFEVFTRLHSKEEYEGTGIGLAICKKIIEQNGGYIRVESKEGKGSTFYFTIKNKPQL